MKKLEPMIILTRKGWGVKKDFDDINYVAFFKTLEEAKRYVKEKFKNADECGIIE